MSETGAKSRWLFKNRAQRWIGSTAALFEPEYTGRLKNVPIIASEQLFIPVSLDGIVQKCQSFELEYYVEFYVENADISTAHLNVVVGCGALMCDPRHEEG